MGGEGSTSIWFQHQGESQELAAIEIDRPLDSHKLEVQSSMYHFCCLHRTFLVLCSFSNQWENYKNWYGTKGFACSNWLHKFAASKATKSHGHKYAQSRTCAVAVGCLAYRFYRLLRLWATKIMLPFAFSTKFTYAKQPTPIRENRSAQGQRDNALPCIITTIDL